MNRALISSPRVANASSPTAPRPSSLATRPSPRYHHLPDHDSQGGRMSGARDSSWIIGKQQAEADNGMVASLHPLASAAGLEILKAGGKPVAPAGAHALPIGVVEPFMSGVGGVAAMVFHSSKSGRTRVV